MNRLNKIRQALSNVLNPAKNAMSLSSQYLKYGRKGMTSDWTEVIMSDQDLYTGYGYGAIRVRANLAARLSLEYVTTDSDKTDFVHPYLEIISESKTFPDYKFWSDISTYLDLEGIYYLMAVRAVEKDDQGNIIRVGAIQEFKMLNPYSIRRIMDTNDTTVVKGYVETKNGMIREIPAEMIIEMRELNPFDDNIPYAMTDAAKDSQFTLKTANDFTRHALRNNINAPGILSTDVVLDEPEFKRFMDRVKAHSKGEPIFGNGQGAITWESMQTALSKSALKDVNEINRESLFAVSGVSKTIMGIEQSGVTRETSKVQKELIIENHILPRIQLIIDSLNQDYENNYPVDYEKNQASIVIMNPVGSDHDAEIKEIDAKIKRYELFSKLINRKVNPILAEQYIDSEKDLKDLNMEIIEMPVLDPKDKPKDDADNAIDKKEDKEINQADDTRSGLVRQQEGSLKNAIKNLDAELVSGMSNRLNDKKKKLNTVTIENESVLITKTQKNRYKKDLAFILANFYTIITQFKGTSTAKDRLKEFGLNSMFKINADVKNRIRRTAKKVADSHIDTVTSDIYETARDAALEGKSLTQIQNLIKDKYNTVVSDIRAKTIARTETNRAFTIAQYEADVQFIEQNKLEGRVFKQWHTRSDNPCEFCLALEAEGPVPFDQNFRDLGSSVEADGNILDINFTSLKAGNAHPNCGCDYELIIDTQENKATLDIAKVEDVINRTNEAVDKLDGEVKEIEKRTVAIKTKERELDEIANELEKVL